jgi:putative addiction module killer protein
LRGLRNRRAAARIASRITRGEDGNLGDVKPVGDGVSEMRIDYGPGYRLYFTQCGTVIAILHCGGAKSMQVKDIANAKRLAKAWKE